MGKVTQNKRNLQKFQLVLFNECCENYPNLSNIKQRKHLNTSALKLICISF